MVTGMRMRILVTWISEHILSTPGWLHEHVVGTLGRQLLDVVELTQQRSQLRVGST